MLTVVQFIAVPPFSADFQASDNFDGFCVGQEGSVISKKGAFPTSPDRRTFVIVFISQYLQRPD